jgi:hypothetical protein
VPSRRAMISKLAIEGTRRPFSTDDTNARVIGVASCACERPRAVRRDRISPPSVRAKPESGPASWCLEIVDSRTSTFYRRWWSPRPGPQKGARYAQATQEAAVPYGRVNRGTGRRPYDCRLRPRRQRGARVSLGLIAHRDSRAVTQ